MSELLRQYEPWECGRKGYPSAWDSWSSPVRGGGTFYSNSEENALSIAETSEPHPPIKDLIREQAGHRCLRCGHPYRKGDGEWSPCDERCSHGGNLHQDIRLYRRPGREPRWEARWRILTVHHLDEDKANCRWWNLASLCQRCHLRMQRAVVMDRVYHFEHSEWFKPFAAGFYAWKYLGENLSREETMARLDELLALEHRFTQEALL